VNNVSLYRYRRGASGANVAIFERAGQRGRRRIRTPGLCARRESCMRTLIVSGECKLAFSWYYTAILSFATYLKDDTRAPPSCQHHLQLQVPSVSQPSHHHSNWPIPTRLVAAEVRFGLLPFCVVAEAMVTKCYLEQSADKSAKCR
jgi:hypothetical protein